MTPNELWLSLSTSTGWYLLFYHCDRTKFVTIFLISTIIFIKTSLKFTTMLKHVRILKVKLNNKSFPHHAICTPCLSSPCRMKDKNSTIYIAAALLTYWRQQSEEIPAFEGNRFSDLFSQNNHRYWILFIVSH